MDLLQHSQKKNMQVCAIIGNPVSHSLSPAMHNIAYATKELAFAYVSFKVETDQLEDAIKGMRALSIRGFSVTIPHKVNVIPFLDKLDNSAKTIGAVNTIVNDKGVLTGYNTDWYGAVKAIEEVSSIEGKNVLILGAGGTARAAIYGCLEKKAKNITILNRTEQKAKSLAEEWDIEYSCLDQLEEKIKDADIVFNSTSVGMAPEVKSTPVPHTLLHSNLVVADAVYTHVPESFFITKAKQAGCLICPGHRMLLWQGVRQFELFTGDKAPVEDMEQGLLIGLSQMGK